MRVALALGSNLGDRAALLRSGVASLVSGLLAADPDAGPAVSPVFETDPVGPAGQDPYLNAVLVAGTSLNADALLALAAAVETAHGRVRAERWGPRTLDVDILSLGDVRNDDPRITLPHPRAHERAFVLVPWSAVDPGASIPGRGTVADLLAALPATDRAGVRPRPDVDLGPALRRVAR